MNENWERVESLFLEALELRPEERSDFLARSCAGHEELRREVESLLAHDDVAGQSIEQALKDTAHSLLESEELAGSRLGAWRVIQEIGHGGMGTVYLASRDDDQFRKRAAIKVVKRGMDTAELLARFSRERQILAHLDHPYIARLIDAGSTPQGRPYLVMEYVEGKPIDVYCREKDLSIDARCRLFLKVCDAVSYAHRNLVVHRDLKPGNILVREDGLPKLLDFGVAKLLDTEPGSGPAITLAAGRLLTPEYASPEQVRGQFVGTASDIYALGAVLYELLTGYKAQRITSDSPVELEKAICDTDVRPPSTRLQPTGSRLRSRLSGDLDNIVLMAMRKEPELRYSSVDLFSHDVWLHLHGRPVTAQPPSLGYRFGKFARRNRLWLAAASLILVSLLGGMWAALSEAHRARTEQQLAEARLSQMVELANRALFDVHGSIERLPGAMEARRQLVKTTVDYLEKLSKDSGNDERLRKALGAAYFRLGDLQGYPYAPNLGDSAGAIKSYQSSAAFLDPIRRAHPADAGAQQPWLENQARLARLMYEKGDATGASKLVHDALPAAIAMERLPDGAVDAQRIQGEFYNLLTDIDLQNNSGDALADARRYLAIFSGLASRYPDRADFVLEESDGYSLVGRVLHSQGDSHGALENYLQCVAIRERLVNTHPNDVVYKRNLMIGYGHVGDILGSPVAASMGDSEGARVYYRKAVAIGEEIHNADPLDSTARFDLAACLERLGMVDVPASQTADSLAALQRSAEMLQQITTENPNSLRAKQMLALVYEYEGRRLQSLRRYSDAIASYQRSLAVSDAILAIDPANRPGLSQVVASGTGMAEAMAMAGNKVGAIHQCRETMARAEAGVNAGPDKRSRERYLAESTIELGAVYEILARHSPAPEQRRDWDAARSALRQAITQLDALSKGTKPMLIETGDLQRAHKLLAEAETHLPASQPGSH
jgi:serine/threonine protein kinase/tetratricopeptide (TPR) repeat protein